MFAAAVRIAAILLDLSQTVALAEDLAADRSKLDH